MEKFWSKNRGIRKKWPHEGATRMVADLQRRRLAPLLSVSATILPCSRGATTLSDSADSAVNPLKGKPDRRDGYA
jgi:hypothetical protein